MSKAKAKGKKENAIVRYIKDTRAELRKVTWPSRQETIRLTQIVLGVTVGMGLFLWLTDVLFSWWLGGVVRGSLLSIGFAVLGLVGGVVATLVISIRQKT